MARTAGLKWNHMLAPCRAPCDVWAELTLLATYGRCFSLSISPLFRPTCSSTASHDMAAASILQGPLDHALHALLALQPCSDGRHSTDWRREVFVNRWSMWIAFCSMKLSWAADQGKLKVNTSFVMFVHWVVCFWMILCASKLDRKKKRVGELQSLQSNVLVSVLLRA